MLLSQKKSLLMARKIPIFLLVFLLIGLVKPVLYGQTVWEWKPPGGVGTGNSLWSDLGANWTRTLGSNVSIPGSRLEWNGFGDPISINDLLGNSYQRISFSGSQSYSLSGNPITLVDVSLGGQGMVNSTSSVNQLLSMPIIFDDNAKEAVISTQSNGRLNFSEISLGNNLTRLNIYGKNIEGVIAISDVLSGSRPVLIGNFEGTPEPNSRVVFSGNNASFTGELSVTGVLTLQSNAALGTSSSSPVSVASGSAIEISGGVSISGRNIGINGNGIGSTGALRNVLGNNSILSDIFLNGNSRIGNDAATTSFTINKVFRAVSSTVSGITFSGVGSIILNDTVGSPTDLLNGNFVKNGTGLLTIRKPCYYNGGTNLISGAEVLLAASHVLSVTGLTLNSGTFRAASSTSTVGYSQNFTQLSLPNNSSIVLGTGNHILNFESSRGAAWTANRRLTIQGWRGNPGESGTAGFGKIYFQSPDGGITPGLTETQLAQITFTGYCDGAFLMPDGELVPALKPFIQNVTSSVAPAGVTGFSGFVGATITISGCLFNNAYQVDVGNTQLKLIPTPQFNLVDSTRITFTLSDTVGGFIKIYTPGGERTNPTPLSNLGYITRVANLPWSNGGSTWLGGVIPPADRPVSINHNNIEVDFVIDSVDFQAPPENPLTIYAGSLKLGGSNRIPFNTPLVLVGGILRLYNANNATPPNNATGNGLSQTFGTLTLRGNSTIAFGNSTGPDHIVQFNASNLIPWTAGARLTIANWVGSPETGGTKTKIFVGNNTNGLTPEQLRQIQFGSLCQGAKILASGELVPAEAPFISNVTSDPSSGTAFQAYYGAKVIVTGCKFDLVDLAAGVKIGSEIVASPTLISSNTIEFIYQENIPKERIYLITSEIPAKEGFSADSLSPAGYATGQNGRWNTPASWLSGISPIAFSKVTVRNTLDVDAEVAVGIDTVIVINGGSLILKDNGLLNIGKNLINRTGGIVSAMGNGRINILDGGRISDSAGTGNPGINMNGFGTVSFLGSGTILGSKQITFHNLWINSGTLTIPVTLGSALLTSLVPWVTGEFRINGGGILAANGRSDQTYGPRYTSSASLVYASGSTQRRGREWYAAPAVGNAAYARNVVVENGTNLIMDGPLPGGNPVPNLTCGGNFTIRSGTVRLDIARPFEILGNLQIGENAGSNAALNIGRLTSEVDAVTPTALTDNPSNYVFVHGDFKIYPNSSYNFRLNTRQFHFSGTGSVTFEVPGADPLATTPALTLNNVHVQKNGIVTLKSSLAISNSIQFSTGGIIKTDPNVFLRIEAAGQMTGCGPTSFVAGRLDKVTNSTPGIPSNDFTFHVGKIIGATPTYKPIKIGNLKHNGTTTYSAEYKDSSTINPPRSSTFLDAFLQGIWSSEFWEVNRVSGSGKARVGIPYAPVPALFWTTSPPGSANVGVVRWTGDSWEFSKEEDNFNDTTNTYPEFLPVAYADTVFSDTIGSFSPFSIGWGGQNILPGDRKSVV